MAIILPSGKYPLGVKIVQFDKRIGERYSPLAPSAGQIIYKPNVWAMPLKGNGPLSLWPNLFSVRHADEALLQKYKNIQWLTQKRYIRELWWAEYVEAIKSKDSWIRDNGYAEIAEPLSNTVLAWKIRLVRLVNIEELTIYINYLKMCTDDWHNIPIHIRSEIKKIHKRI